MKKLLVLIFFFMFIPICTLYAANWSLTDPGADRILGWDDSNTGSEVSWFVIGTGLSISNTTISVNSNLAIYSGITPSVNVQSFLGASDYSSMRTFLGLVIGTNVQAYDPDLATASTANGASNSTYFGKNSTGTVGFHSLPPADLGFGVDAPGAAGALLQSNGTKWERVTSLSGLTFGGFTASKMVESDGSGNLISSSFAPGDVALNTGDVYSGVHDFGGATSVEIPNGASPIVDAAGEIAIDTTSDTIKYYGGAERVIPYKQVFSIVVPSVAATDDMLVLKAPYGMTMLSLDCIVSAATSATINIQECDSAGANCSDTATSDLTCDTDGANTTTFSNVVIDSGDWVKLDIASISGTPGTLTVTVTYSVVGD